MTILPDTGRPEMGRHAAEQLLLAHGVLEGPALLARRGYYRDAMGEPGVNDRGIYDDAIMLVTPTAYVTFNANCDPSRQQKGVATLDAGVWKYKLGIHGVSRPKDQQYPALVQAAPVVVRRDWTLNYRQGEVHPDYGRCLGGGRWTDADRAAWNRFMTNVHRGGRTTTGSLGCLTIHPAQWEEFYALVKGEMERHGVVTIPCLVSEREAAS